jgi:general secretion pathway protein K
MRQRGAVFVVTLAILTILVATVASIAASEELAVKEQINATDQVNAQVAANAGIQRAIEVLCDESASGVTSSGAGGLGNQGSNVNQVGVTTLQDDWATLGTTGNDRFTLKNASFRLQILDACSRVNLNTATQQQLQTLPLTQQQIDSILDWRSAGETARADGAKDAVYNSLQNPYDAALQNFSTVDELLDVQPFVPADLYDTPTTQPLGGTALPDFADGRTPTLAELLTVDSSSNAVNAQGRTLQAFSNVSLQTLAGMGFNRAGAQALFNARRDTTWAQIVRTAPFISTAQFRNLLNNYYLGSSTQAGKINVNTASQAVLQTVPGITSDEATSIVNQQSAGITSMGNLLNLQGLTSVRTAAPIVDLLTVHSNVFLVRVIGTAGQAQVPLEAVVSVTTPTNGQSATARILNIETPPFNDMTGRWGWQTQTTNDVPLEAGS